MKSLLFYLTIFFLSIHWITAQEFVSNDQTITDENPEYQQFVKGNNHLAFALYKKYKDKPGNIFFSPVSIYSALTMTYEGASGITAKEMEETFHMPIDEDFRRKIFLEFFKQINKNKKDYSLTLANALWIHEKFQVKKEFVEIIEKYYKGAATNLDFVNKPDESRKFINQWVEDQTGGKIIDFLSESEIDQRTKLVLTNAVYFKGSWVTEFDKKLTNKDIFHINNEEIVAIQMMHRNDEESRYRYAETDNMQMIEMPYTGDDLSILLILPKTDLNHLEDDFNEEILNGWKEQLIERKVNISIPKFKIEEKISLKEALEELGMKTAFNDHANFSKIGGDLKIGNVIHQSTIELNEEGTEAAAATAVIFVPKSIRHIPEFRADHPFIIILQEKKTGNILFMGRIQNPVE